MPLSKQPNPYLRYSNLAIQMAVIIGIGAWGGKKLDQYFSNQRPVCTIIFSLLGIFAALYVVLRDLMRDGKE